MNTNHIVSLVLALMAALLVIVAGRSCVRSAERANNQSRKKISTTSPQNNEEQYTQLHQNFGDQTPGNPQNAAEATTVQYVTVTDIFGDVVETIPVTTEAQIAPEEIYADIPTTTLSILDEYNLSIGEDIDADDKDEKVTTTEYIEPETNITLYID